MKKNVYISLLLMSLFVMQAAGPACAERFIVVENSITLYSDPSEEYDDICNPLSENFAGNNATWDNFTAITGAQGIWSGSVCNESLLNVTNEETEIDVWTGNIMTWQTEQSMNGASEAWIRSPFHIENDDVGEIEMDIYKIDSYDMEFEDSSPIRINYDLDEWWEMEPYIIDSENVEYFWDNPTHYDEINSAYDYSDSSKVISRSNLNGGDLDEVNLFWHSNTMLDSDGFDSYVLRGGIQEYSAPYSSHPNRGSNILLNATKSPFLLHNRLVPLTVFGGTSYTLLSNNAELYFWSSERIPATSSTMCMSVMFTVTNVWNPSGLDFYVPLHGSRSYCVANSARAPNPFGYFASDYAGFKTEWDRQMDLNWDAFSLRLSTFYNQANSTSGSHDLTGDSMDFEFVGYSNIGDINANNEWRIDDITFVHDVSNQPDQLTGTVEFQFEQELISDYDPTLVADRLDWDAIGAISPQVSSKIDQKFYQYTASSKPWNPGSVKGGTVWDIEFTFGNALNGIDFTIYRRPTRTPGIISHPQIMLRNYYRLDDAYNGEDHVGNFMVVDNRTYHKVTAPLFSWPNRYLFMFHYTSSDPYTMMYVAQHDDGNDGKNLTNLKIGSTEYQVTGGISLGISTLLTTGMGDGVRGHKITLEEDQIFKFTFRGYLREAIHQGQYLNLIMAFWNLTDQPEVQIKLTRESTGYSTGWVDYHLKPYTVFPGRYGPRYGSITILINIMIKNPNPDPVTFYMWGISEEDPTNSAEMKHSVSKKMDDTQTTDKFRGTYFRPWIAMHISSQRLESINLPAITTPTWDIQIGGDFIRQYKPSKSIWNVAFVGGKSINDFKRDFISTGRNAWRQLVDGAENFFKQTIDAAKMVYNDDRMWWLRDFADFVSDGFAFVIDWTLGLGIVGALLDFDVFDIWNWALKIGDFLTFVWEEIVPFILEALDFIWEIIGIIIPIMVFVWILNAFDKLLLMFATMHSAGFSKNAENFISHIFKPLIVASSVVPYVGGTLSKAGSTLTRKSKRKGRGGAS